MRKIYLSALAIAAFGLAQAQVTINRVGSYLGQGGFDEGATEITAYDPATFHLFSTNGAQDAVDIIDLSDPTSPVFVKQVSITSYGGGINSVAFQNGIMAVAVEADPATDPGKIVFFDTDGNYISDVTVGALPDMVTFTPDGNLVITANEGEPNDAYDIDPEGSVSIIDVSNGVASISQNQVTNVDFTQFNGQSLDASIKVVANPDGGTTTTVAQDLEPEYIAVTEDNSTAYAFCQENNAVVVIDLATKAATAIVGLGFKDHSLTENALDPSNRDDTLLLRTFDNLFGVYQPDAAKAVDINGATYLLTANEGDARDYDGYSEEERVKDIVLDSIVFPNYRDLQKDEVLGRLNTTTAIGDTDGDGDHDVIYAYGARSFTVWDANGNLVWDSGSEFEQYLLDNAPEGFNATNDENGADARSDDKGPEPEAIEWMRDDNGKTVAFIGLERIGGVMIYDISNPSSPSFESYSNNRDYTLSDSLLQIQSENLDLGPENILKIMPQDSPDGKPYIVVSNEISGTISIWEVSGLTFNPTAIANKQTAEALNLFPNPVAANGIVRANIIDNYEVYSVFGMRVATFNNTNVLDFSALESGMYIVRNTLGDSQTILKK